MIDNDELKKKIVEVIDNWANTAVKVKKSGASVYDPYNAAELADALIAAGIGDMKWQHDVFKKAYMDFFTKLNLDKEFRKRFDSITLGCQIGKFEDMIDQAEKELAEERK